MPDLSARLIVGISLTSGVQVFKQTLQFVISIILSRLLTPHDFGLVGMITVFTGFISLFNELGFGVALIQKEKVTEQHYSSIFWLNLLSGLSLTGVTIIVAPFVAKFYDEPQLASLMRLIATSFFISSMGIVQNAILIRTLQFRLLSIVEIVKIVFAGAFAVLLAIAGYGFWSLAWQFLTMSIISTLGLWWATNWHPQLSFSWIAVKDLVRFSINLLGFNTLQYWVRNGDNLLIGKYMGSEGLGIYFRAYNLMLFPLNQITSVLGVVMLPTLSRMQNDKRLTKLIYLRMVGAIAFFLFPLMMGMFVAGEHLIMVFYGSQWGAVIPLLRIFSLLGLVQSLSVTVGLIYQSQGRTDWLFRWGLVTGILLIGSIIIGVYLGTIQAVAIAYAFTSGIILLYPSFAIPGRLIDMTFWDVITTIKGVGTCAIFMTVLVFIMDALLPTTWPHWAHLVIIVPFGIIVYLLLVHLCNLQVYREVKSILSYQLSKRLLMLRSAN